MFAKAILVGAFAALAAAQSSVLTFTRVPNPITAGEPQAITYATNDTTTPVSIILRKGDSNDLKTVSTLTTDATGGQYIWTPSETLENDSDYALEIEQGSQLNYYGPFSIQGGGQASSSSSSTASATIMASMNSTMTTMSASAGTGTSMSRNTTMSSATLTATTSTTLTASTTSDSAGFQTTSAAPTKTNAASSVAHGSSAVALIFGALAAILYC